MAKRNNAMKTSQVIRVKEFDQLKTGGLTGEEVVMTPDMVLFWKPPAVFCQWTKSIFEMDRTTYCCAEQFMMAEKARVFRDRVTESAILATEDPAEHQKLGRQVRGFSAYRWEQVRFDIVVKANLAKFQQNPDMLETLLETETRTLVEASPRDTIWGIGLSASDADAYEPSRWKGRNLLGKALMEVRALVKLDPEMK